MAGLRKCPPMWQKGLNSTARLVASTGKRKHIIPALTSSHLKVTVQDLGVCTQATAWDYLSFCGSIIGYQLRKSLKYQSEILLNVPNIYCLSYDNKCFRQPAATPWNNLPLTIRTCKAHDTFKKEIKTKHFLLQLISTEHSRYCM
jgi:hypothetical protein